MCPSHPSLGGGGTTSPSAWQPPSQSRRDTGSPDWGCQEKERERGGDRFPLDKGPRGGSFGHLESVAWVELGLDGGVDLVGSRIGASSILAVEPSDALGRRLGHPPPVGGFREPVSHSWRPPDKDSKGAHQVGWRRCVEWRGTPLQQNAPHSSCKFIAVLQCTSASLGQAVPGTAATPSRPCGGTCRHSHRHR